MFTQSNLRENAFSARTISHLWQAKKRPLRGSNWAKTTTSEFTLIHLNKIQLIRGEEKEQDYLYHKDEYVEDEVAVTEVKAKSTKKVKENADDFDLPDIEDEEIPDFLVGEEVDKI